MTSQSTDARSIWKDTTSYSRGKERVPTCWSLTLGDIHISVLTGHLDAPDHWVLHCEPWYRARQIGSKQQLETHEAQRLALDLVEGKIRKALAALTASRQVQG